MFKVLLVEDNPADVFLAQTALASSGVECEMHVVRNCFDAYTFLKRTGDFRSAPRPDLIILDWKLPYGDGATVLEEIRSDKSLQGVPVAVHSASIAPQDVQKAYELGSNCWVGKVSDLEEQLRRFSQIVKFWSSVPRRPRQTTSSPN